MAKSFETSSARNLLYAALDTQVKAVYQPAFNIATDPDFSGMDTRTLLSCYLIMAHMVAHGSMLSEWLDGPDWTSINSHFYAPCVAALNNRALALCGVADGTKLVARWRDVGGMDGPDAFAADLTTVDWSKMSFDQLKATAMLLEQMALRGVSEGWDEDDQETPAGYYVIDSLYSDVITVLGTRLTGE